MGCHRSGTNLLYDMLLSSGGFAIYRGFLPIYKILIPRFGSMASRANREKILETWLRSKGFRRTGLDAEQLSARILNECRNGGDFIRVVMDSVAGSQQVQRWAVYDPDNVLHVERVKRDIPNALFVHIIRDGRDIALSLKKMGGFSPLPWDRGQTDSLVATALYWEWMVHRGRAYGRKFPADYIEIRYEDLITNPRDTLGNSGVLSITILTTIRFSAPAWAACRKRTLRFAKKVRRNRSTRSAAGRNVWRTPMSPPSKRPWASACRKMAMSSRCPPPSAAGACDSLGCAECIPPFSAASCG